MSCLPASSRASPQAPSILILVCRRPASPPPGSSSGSPRWARGASWSSPHLTCQPLMHLPPSSTELLRAETRPLTFTPPCGSVAHSRHLYLLNKNQLNSMTNLSSGLKFFQGKCRQFKDIFLNLKTTSNLNKNVLGFFLLLLHHR